MNINVTKKTLGDALDLLARVIPARSTNPALTSVLIETHSQGLTLSGTNLEIDLALDVPAETGLGADGNRLLLPAHLLHAAVKRAGGQLIELEVDGGRVVMRSGGGTTKFQTLAAEDYARLTFEAGGVGLDAPAFHRALTSVLYAASTEAFQAVFRGVLLTFGAQGGQAVASDGYRVATCRFPVHDTGFAGQVIVPGRSLTALLPLLQEARELSVRPGDGVLALTTESARVNVKLLDGDFPDWERVVPKDIRFTARLSKAAFVEALQRAALFTDANANNRIELLFAEGRVRLNAENEYGQASEEVDAELGGVESAMSVSMNTKLLLNAAGPLEGDLELHLSGSTTPMIVRSPSDPAPMAVVVALRP